MIDLRNARRCLIEHRPLFFCKVCLQRFNCKKKLKKHEKKEFYKKYNHIKFFLKENIYNAQLYFLKKIKFSITNVYFPFYYELINEKKLPKFYYPQIFDFFGKKGRPVGVVDSFRTIRTLDVLGLYTLYIYFF
jgi:hypothetical protein